MLVVSDVYTLPDLLARAVNKFPDSDIVVFPESRTTYKELYERASKAACSLKSMGIGSGDSVGILMSNCLEFVDLLIGSQLIGAVPVPMFPPPAPVVSCGPPACGACPCGVGGG